MAREDWEYGLYKTDDDGNFVQVIGGVGPLEIATDGETITNLVTGDTYDLTNIGSGGSSSDTHTAVSDDGTEVVASVDDIDFASLLGVADDGDGTVTVTGTDTHTDISQGGTQALADVADINFGPEFSVADDGDGSATVTTTDDQIRTRQANIPLTEIADGNTAVGLQKQVPSGKTLKILEMGVTDDSESAPSGLTVEVQDLTNAVTIHSVNAKHAEGSPLASKDGAIDVQFRVANATGASVNASGYVLYTME